MTHPPLVNLKHLRRLRAILTRHQNAAVRSVPRSALRKWAKTFGLLQDDHLLLESDGEMTIPFDFLV
jgi:hypothetical protein